MSTRHILFSMLAAASVFVIGCDNMKMQQPKWDWWNKDEPVKEVQEDQAAQDTLEDEKTAAADADNEQSVGPVKPVGVKHETRKANSSTLDPELMAKVKKIKLHREKVWAHVSMLQEMDKLTPSQRTDIKRRIIENMDEWYAPMPLSPPNTNEQGWTDIVIWDFMPDEKYNQAVANWKKIAETNKVEFPANITRRGLLKFIDDMLNNNFESAKEETNTADK